MSVTNPLRFKHFTTYGLGCSLTKVTQALLFGAMLFGATTVLCAQDTVTPSKTDSDSIRSIPEATSVAPTKADTEDYVISPDDELDIYVLDVAELSRTYRVS